MRLLRVLVAALSLSFLSVAAEAQQRLERSQTGGLGRVESSDHTRVPTFAPAFAPAYDPNEGLRRNSYVTPPPLQPVYNGEWVYTYTPEILPLPGNGFAWFKYVLTCINGTCDPNEGAGLVAYCPVDGWGVFSGANSQFCPRRAIYG